MPKGTLERELEINTEESYKTSSVAKSENKEYMLVARKKSIKQLLCKIILNPIWTLGDPASGISLRKYNASKWFQTKTLRTILSTLRYVSNSIIHAATKIMTECMETRKS